MIRLFAFYAATFLVQLRKWERVLISMPKEVRYAQLGLLSPLRSFILPQNNHRHST